MLLFTLFPIFERASSDNDIILDFFAGSGTTGHAVLELNKEDGGNRKFVLVEQLDEHITICCERNQKVIQNYIKEAQEQPNNLINEVQQLQDNTFIYFELAEYNQKFVHRIEQAQTPPELAQIYTEMEKNGFLSYQFQEKAFKEKQADFEALPLEGQKTLLMELLDKNMLYLNFDDIEDSTYNVDKETIELNKQFYKRYPV